MTQVLIALSKKSKKSNPRAKFLSDFMKLLSMHPDVVSAYAEKDNQKFMKAMMRLSSALTKGGEHEE